MDEIALNLPDAATLEMFRGLVNRSREVGVAEAYRPLLAQELLSDWMNCDLKTKHSMLMERKDELLGDDVADVVAALREQEPDDGTLIMHEALLNLARSGQGDMAFEVISDPEKASTTLSDLGRSGDADILEMLATILLHIDTTDIVRAAAWFHMALALSLKKRQEEAIQAVREARRLDDSHVPTWLAFLVEMAVRRPELIPLSRALVEPLALSPNVNPR